MKEELQAWALTVLAGIAVGIASGLSAAMAWFRGAKTRIYEKIEEDRKSAELRISALQVDMDRRYDKIELFVQDVLRVVNQHAVQISVLSESTTHIDKKLEDLRMESREHGRKLDQLLQERCK